MTLTFVLAPAFAALCVWLIVRIINRRESWAKWTFAVVIIYAAYFVAVYHATGGAILRIPSELR